MADIRPVAFEHAQTETLVCLRRNGLQILRQGEFIRRKWARSLSKDAGSRMLCDNELFDLRSPVFPMPIGTLEASGGQLLPTFDSVVRWFPSEKAPYTEPLTGRKLAGLLCIDLGTGAADVWWGPNEAFEGADLHLAEDGLTWVLVAGRKLQMGQGNTVSLYHEDTESLERFSFDLPRSRIVVSFSRTRKGLLSLPIRRTTPLSWAEWLENEPNVLPVISPVTVVGDDLLAVVRGPSVPGKLPAYEVWRFHESLRPRGRYEGFPRRFAKSDDQVLLRLADGTVGWFVETDLVLVSPGAKRITTDAVRVMDPWQVSAEAMDGALEWLREHGSGQVGALEKLAPVQRRVLTRYLLDRLVDTKPTDEEVRQFEWLAKHDPVSFAPHADGILGWSDERLARFAAVSPKSYWLAATGATTRAVRWAVERLRARLPQDEAEKRQPTTDEATARLVMLLVGADTEDALAELGPLGREFAAVEALCRQGCLDIPEEGPAVRRFTYAQQAILIRNAPPPGSIILNPMLQAPRFRRPSQDELERPAFLEIDKLPKISLLSIETDALPGGALKKSRRPLHEFVYLGSQYRGDPSDTWDTFEGLAKKQLEVKLQPAEVPVDPAFKQVGTLGGRPDWVQDPAVPYCRYCGMTMHYVGNVSVADLLDPKRQEQLYSFHCVWCGELENVPQPLVA